MQYVWRTIEATGRHPTREAGLEAGVGVAQGSMGPRAHGEADATRIAGMGRGGAWYSVVGDRLRVAQGVGNFEANADDGRWMGARQGWGRRA
eukprot:scaffold10623_cov139-Isochrysis_galbana.AAC.1